MISVYRELYRAIHEGMWLRVDYVNLSHQNTSYWIAVEDLNPRSRTLLVRGMQRHSHQIRELHMKLDGIQALTAIDGTYAPVNAELVERIAAYPEEYAAIFGGSEDLAVLSYLSACMKHDGTAAEHKFALLPHLDDIQLRKCDSYALDPEQFSVLAEAMESNARDRERSLGFHTFGMNLLSFHLKKGGIYLLAYLPLKLDVEGRSLRIGGKPIVNLSFRPDPDKDESVSLASLLGEDGQYLLGDFDANAEKIRDLLSENPYGMVDDEPYVVDIEKNSFSLDRDFRAVHDIMQKERSGIPVPLKAFFGDMVKQPSRKRPVDPVLTDHKINLDQLRVITHAMRDGVCYVQGPPGTGKTSTIFHVMTTAFANAQTVLLSAYNNHPIEEIYARACALTWQGRAVPFPILRIGTPGYEGPSLQRAHACYEAVKKEKVPALKAGLKNPELQKYIEKYEERADLLERKDALEELLKESSQMNFRILAETEQMPEIDKRLKALGSFDEKEALALVRDDTEAAKALLYSLSVRHLQRLNRHEFQDLREIIESEDCDAFNTYIREDENLAKVLKVFPVLAVTCLSCVRLGSPSAHFDLVIIDEASQCSNAAALPAADRGNRLLLSGDPNQLQPVIQLSPAVNEELMHKYGVTREYDYLHNSIYKTCLAADALSEEILLSHHYRCDPRIIAFSNHKYYHDKLHIEGKKKTDRPLVFMNVERDVSGDRHTAPMETDAVMRLVQAHPETQFGIITPFRDQREAIAKELKARNLNNASAGTVHAFQGDEKDVILFSLALTNRTARGTYAWLKNNRELINVAVSRARERFVMIGSEKELERFHEPGTEDDLYDLYRYVVTSGQAETAPAPGGSRALGIRPYSTQTEAAFMENLNHALDNAFADGSRYTVKKEVAVAQVFACSPHESAFFYQGRFDFVIYRKFQGMELPQLAIELDGLEHRTNAAVAARDRKKEEICKRHGFELIRVDNTYARRYHYIRSILIRYFTGKWA